MVLSLISLLLLLLLLDCSELTSGERIAATIQPQHYDLILLPILGKNPRLCGHIFIDFEAKKTTNLFALHGIDFNVLEASVKPEKIISLTGSNGKRNTSRYDKVEDACFSGLTRNFTGSESVILIHDQQTTRQELHFVLKESLVHGRRYRLSLLYTATVYDTSQGFFMSSYTKQDTCCQSWFGATQMEVGDARRVLPCMDEPVYKATFDITVGHQNPMRALSNMPEKSVRSMSSAQSEEGWMWTEFTRSPLMSTYLLAFVITDYDMIEQVHRSYGRSVRLRFWGKKEHMQYLNQTIKVTSKMISYLETELKQPFSLPKIDFIAPPAGLSFQAMENWGLIIFQENLLFHIEDSDSERDRFEDGQVMAHELSHQFFGNLVTSDWWSDIWLNEGFSSLFEFIVVNKVMPNSLVHSNTAYMESIQNVLRIEELQKSRPAVQSAKTVAQSEELFDRISYNKGSSILRMLRNFLGHSTFREGLVTYMHKYQFQNANSSQLWSLYDDLVHRDRNIGRQFSVTAVMESWTLQPAFPVVTCMRSAINRVHLSQMPFPGKYKIDSAVWYVPLALTNGQQPDFTPVGTFPRIWLTPERPELEVTVAGVDQISTWILINGEMTGYYRVLYDSFSYQLIINQLLSNYSVIPDLTRSQLVDDAFALAAVELLDYEVPLLLVEYLSSAKDDFVLPIAVRHLNYMKAVTTEPDHIALLEQYLRKITSQPEDSPDQFATATTIELDSIINFARNEEDHGYLIKEKCEQGETKCVDQAMRLFRENMDGSITSSDKKLMSEEFELVWCTALRHSTGPNEWKFAWKKSIQPQFALHRTKILSAMSCTTDQSRLKQLLGRVFHHEIEQDPHDTFAIIEKMADNPSARAMALQFIMANWKPLNKHLGRSSETLKLLEAATKVSNNIQEYNKIARFLADEKLLNARASSAAVGILDNIRNNINWVERNSNHVVSSLLAKNLI